MTATPHSGKEADFQLFMSLLDRDRFSGKFVKGTKMIYSVPDEKDRQDVIAYLKTFP